MDLEMDVARKVFIDESSDLLQEMENALLTLEESPDDEATINALFRAAHTIKGSAGIIGLEEVEKFTHKVESVLEKVRQGTLKIDTNLIEILLKCRDHISSLIGLPERAESGPSSLEFEKHLVSCLEGYLSSEKKEVTQPKDVGTTESSDEKISGVQSDTWHISLRFGKDVLRSGMDPSSFINYLTRLGEIISITTLYENVPPLSELDPESCYLGFEIDFKSDFTKKDIEDVFEFVKEDCSIHILPPHSRIDEYIKLIQSLPEDPLKIGEILVKGGALTDAELEEALKLQADTEKKDLERPMPLGEILVKEGMVHPEVVTAAVEKQKKTIEIKSQEAKTLKIDAEKLDSLINLVGELVIAYANIAQHSNRIKDGGLSESVSIMQRLVENIRDNAMTIRMVPIAETFNKFNRIVRDISKDFGKEIDLVINGGDTELDKTVIEKIGDPLMHLVRNAADHGIEMPDIREAKGKPRRGTIKLNAYHDAGSIVIEVVDDGKGLAKEKILQKAIERGLVAQGASLSDNEIFRLVFEPGFSTAEKVTKFSGRGVGMDVVRKNIEALRGSVDMMSEEGKGTTVQIRLPLTLAIIDGFMVGVGDSRYVIPLDMIVECVELSEMARKEAITKKYINLRGEVLPFIRMRDFFNERALDLKFENIVVVQYAGNKTGLIVDELFGEVQAVIKSLGKMFKKVEGISGATILGDGTVALIIDVPHLVHSFEKEELGKK
ncbi:MAG: chemotaxis protein CheA [Thermodesulfovibrionales bacterium]|nr:chemotaxis protein CheA [Thermodesulfovibrionales bacterium]